MSLTLKQICDNVLLEAGFQTQSAYSTATQDHARRIFALANRSARQISRWPYQKLKKTWSITQDGSGSYTPPSDFRYPIFDTAWSSSQIRKAHFVSEEFWSFLQTQAGTGVEYKILFEDGNLLIENDDSGETLEIRYVSDNPIESSDGNTSKPRFTADNDVWLLDDELIQLDLKWRFLEAQGYSDWQRAQREYFKHRSRVRGTEAGNQTISLVSDLPSGTPPYAPYTDNWD